MIRAAQINWYGVQKQIENVYKNKVKHFIQKFLRFWTLKIAQKLTKTNTSPAQPKFSTHTNSCTFIQKKILFDSISKEPQGFKKLKKEKKLWISLKYQWLYYKISFPVLQSRTTLSFINRPKYAKRILLSNILQNILKYNNTANSVVSHS